MADNYAKHVSFEIFFFSLVLVHHNENEPIIDVTGMRKKSSTKGIQCGQFSPPLRCDKSSKKLLEKLKLV
jgi:hypothetical protein